MTTWTDERVEKLKALWKEGLSSTQIAMRMGLPSRSAVIGKLFRLGLTDEMRGNKSQKVIQRIVRAGRPKSTFGKAAPTTQPPPQVETPPQFQRESFVPIIDDEIDVPASERKALVDLDAGDCRWPIGHPGDPGFGFCGKSAASGLAYCEAHAHRAYRQPEPSRSIPSVPSSTANDNEPRVTRRDLVDA